MYSPTDRCREEEPLEQELELPSYLQHAASTGAMPEQPDFVDELPPPKESETVAAEGEVRAA